MESLILTLPVTLVLVLFGAGIGCFLVFVGLAYLAHRQDERFV